MDGAHQEADDQDGGQRAGQGAEQPAQHDCHDQETGGGIEDRRDAEIDEQHAADDQIECPDEAHARIKQQVEGAHGSSGGQDAEASSIA